MSEMGGAFSLFPCMDVFHGRKAHRGENNEIKMNAMTDALNVAYMHFHLSILYN